MFNTEILVYRPTKISDGQGGSVESIGTPVTMWAKFIEHENQEFIVLDIGEDVKVGDFIAPQDNISPQNYRVSGISFLRGAGLSRFRLEKIEQPITAVVNGGN